MDVNQEAEISPKVKSVIGVANATGKRFCGLTAPIQLMSNSSTGRRGLLNATLKKRETSVTLQLGKIVILALPLTEIQSKPSSIEISKTASTSSFFKPDKSIETENSSPNAVAFDMAPLRGRKRSYATSLTTHQQNASNYRDIYCLSPMQSRRIGVDQKISSGLLKLDTPKKGIAFIENPTFVDQEDALLAFSILGNFESM